MTRSAIITALLMWGGCAPAASAFDHAAVARQALEGHIRPGYDRLAEAADGLEAAVTALCRAPSAARHEVAARAFADTVRAWGRLEALRFGPITEDHRFERLLFWPDPKGIGRRQVRRALAARDGDLTSTAGLARKSVALQGLGALDQMLPGLGEDDAFRCGYAGAIAANVAQIAAETAAAWRDPRGFSALFLSPGADNPVYRQPSEVTQELVKAYTAGLQQITELKLARPLGRGRGAPPPFMGSGLALPLIVANIEGVRELFVQGGLMAELDAANPGLGASLVNEFDRALDLARTITVPLREAAGHPQAQNTLALMALSLANAQNTGGRSLTEIAGLSLGFNALDGD